MQDIKIDGKSNFNGGEYGAIIIDGSAECHGDIKAETIQIDGKFKCFGKLTADFLNCDGSAEIEADINVKKIVIDGLLAVTNGTKLYSQEIICDGAINIGGQISADNLKVDGFLSAKEIVGDNIIIKSNLSKFAKLFTKTGCKVEIIEATNIELVGVVANVVNGHNITIGKGCEINSLDCSGTLVIDEKSTVKNITGNYAVGNV